MAQKRTEHCVILKDVRLSFPRLFTPRAFKPGQKPKYEATFLLDPSRKEHAAHIKQIEEAAFKTLVDRYGSKDKIPKGIKRTFNYSDKTDPPKEYDGYPGMFFIAASNTEKVKPQIVGPKKDPATGKLQVLTEQDNMIYGGCYVNGKVSFYVYDNPAEPTHGKKLLTNLLVVQYARKGDPFGVRPPDAEEDFDALEEDDTQAGIESEEEEEMNWDN